MSDLDPEVRVLAPLYSSALELLRERLDDIVEDILRNLKESIPVFAQVPAQYDSTLREVALAACNYLLRLLEEESVAEGDIKWGDFRGLELEEILHSFQVGSEVAWRWIKRTWSEAGYPLEETLKAAELLWRFYFSVTDSVAREFIRQRQESADRFNDLLNRIRTVREGEELLRLITMGACDVLGYRRAVLFLVEREMMTPVSAADREDQAWGKSILDEEKKYPLSPMADNLVTRAFYEPSIKVSKAEDGERVAFLTPSREAHFALVPVKPEGSPSGLLYVETEPLGKFIRKREVELLSAYAEAAGMALENLRLYRELETKRKIMDNLMSRVNTAHEEERARIARELHDSVAQSLLKIIYAAGFALDFLKENPPLAVDEINEVQQRAKDCLGELRAIMSNLRPTSLDILGLKETVLRYAEQFEEEYAISVSVDLEGLESLPPSAELPVFRILQEELTNVRKHSNAGSVHIRSQLSQGDFVLAVEDDGVGFDPHMLEAEQESGKQLGLMAIRERVELLGGDMRIDSTPGMGTRITVRIPMVGGGEG